MDRFASELPTVVLAALGHYQFESLHPTPTGTGGSVAYL